MTISDLATFSTAVSGLAVTASLIYLAMQTHQNAKHTRALVHQERASRILNAVTALYDADVAAAFILGNGGVPTPEAVKQHQFEMICSAYFASFNDSYTQYRHGLLDEEAMSLTNRNLARTFGRPGIRAAWELWKEPGAGFTLFVDGVLSSTPPVA